MIMEWIRKLTDMIMPLEPVVEEETDKKESKKAETKVAEPKSAPQPTTQQPAEQQPVVQSFQREKQAAVGNVSQNIGLGTRTFARNSATVSTSDSGVTSMGGMRYEAYTSEAEVRPSLAVVKTPQLTIKIYAPNKYDEMVRTIGTDLIKRNAIVINYEGVGEVDQQRIGDFILGVVYTINGRVEMISDKIVLYVPEGFEVAPAQSVVSSSLRRYN